MKDCLVPHGNTPILKLNDFGYNIVYYGIEGVKLVLREQEKFIYEKN